MFDVSWTELLIIGVVAVVVVGPKDMPRMMRLAGQWAGRARSMAAQFRSSFEDMARQSELEEMRAEMMKTYNDKSLKDIQRETDIMMGNLPPDAPANAEYVPPSIAPPGLTTPSAPPPEFTGERMAPAAPPEPAPSEKA